MATLLMLAELLCTNIITRFGKLATHGQRPRSRRTPRPRRSPRRRAGLGLAATGDSTIVSSREVHPRPECRAPTV